MLTLVQNVTLSTGDRSFDHLLIFSPKYLPGEFPAQRPVTRILDVFSDLRLNTRLCKQSWGWWFESCFHLNFTEICSVFDQQYVSIGSGDITWTNGDGYGRHQASISWNKLSCQPDEPLAFLVTTNRIINVYGFIVVIMLLIYSALRCLYYVGNKITTTTGAGRLVQVLFSWNKPSILLHLQTAEYSTTVNSMASYVSLHL